MPHHSLRPFKNLYTVLDLPSPSPITLRKQPVSAEEIKRAYRTALLRCHPDKNSSGGVTELGDKGALYTVDDIVEAYKVLSCLDKRREYDRALALLVARDQADDPKRSMRGVAPAPDTLDLDDLPYDSEAGIWYRPCRCGAERGFSITEKELEGEAESGEVLVGCKGCSLWIRVLFRVVDEEEQEEEDG